MASMDKKKYLKNINKELPIYIHGGSDDPVSNNGVGLNKLLAQYEKIGVKDVKLTIYDGARHEIYNETNYKEAYENTLKFVCDHI